MPSVARSVHIVVLLGMLVGIAAAQQAAETPAQQPTFLDSVPVDCTTFLYLNDPLPHLEKALASENARKLFQQFSAVLPPEAPVRTPEQALAMVQAFQGYVPEELAIGMPPAAYVQFVRACRIGLYAGLAVGSRLQNETENIVALQNRIISEVRNLKMPRIVVYAKFREEAIPQLIMGLASSLVPLDGDVSAEGAFRRGGTMEDVPVEQLRMQQPAPRGGPEEEPPVEDPRADYLRARQRDYEEPPQEESPVEDPRAIEGRGRELPSESPPVEGAEVGGFSLPVFEPSDSKQVSLDIAVSDYLPVEAIAPALQQFGGFDQDRSHALAEAIGNLALQAILTREETALQLTIGPGADRKLRPLKSKPLNPLWKAGPDLLYYAQWDIAGLKKPWEALVAEWKKWESTPAGAALKQLDTDGMLADLSRSESALERMATRGAFRATVGDRSLDMTMHELEFPPSPALAEVPVTDLFPKSSTIMVADSTKTLADVISDYFAQLENRLAARSFPGGPRGEMADAALDTYHSRLKGLQTLVHDESRSMFVPPVGYVTSTGKLGKISVSIVGVTETGGDRQSETRTSEVSDREVSEFALIGRLASGSEPGKRFYADLYQSFHKILAETPVQDVVEERDLGLGVSTMVFLPTFTRLLPVEVTISAEGDLLPHYFVLDGWLVLSTSPRLSKAIVDAAATPTQEVKVPQVKNKLVALGWISKPALLQLTTDAATFMEVLSVLNSDESGISMAAGIGQASGLVKALIQPLNHVKWYVTETPDMRITSYRVVWEK